MKRQLIALFVVFASLTVSFIATTALLDTVCRLSGYYAEGINDERALFNE